MTTQTHPNPAKAISALRALLRSGDAADVPLTIDDDGYVVEGEWLHLIVKPARTGVRAHQYVDALGELEKKLREKVGPNILLVPAMPD